MVPDVRQAKTWVITNALKWNPKLVGGIEACADALQTQPEFVYVTLNGEPAEMKNPPFNKCAKTTILATAISTSEFQGMQGFCRVPGIAAVEYKRPKQAAEPWRVRLYHDRNERPQYSDVVALLVLMASKTTLATSALLDSSSCQMTSCVVWNSSEVPSLVCPSSQRLSPLQKRPMAVLTNTSKGLLLP